MFVQKLRLPSPWGVDVASAIDIFHLHVRIISSEAAVKPPKPGDSFTGIARRCFFFLKGGCTLEDD